MRAIARAWHGCLGSVSANTNQHRPQWTLPPSLLAQEIAPCRAFPSQQAACGRRLAVCDRRISRSRRKDGTWSERRR